MAGGLNSERALVVLQNDKHRIAAHFFWFESPPESTYLINTDEALLELDSHFPVRPKTIYAPKRRLAVAGIEKYLGRELSGYLPKARGWTAVYASLDADARFQIAEQQALSDRTSESLREACINMVVEHSNV